MSTVTGTKNRSMAREISLDDVKELRLVKDKPIRILFFAEAMGNIPLIIFTHFYPSTLLAYLLKPEREITPLTAHVLLWWNSWIFIITGLLFAAIPSKYNTPTLTAGLVHVRRFIYWALLASEVLLIFLLTSSRHRTIFSIGMSIIFVFIVIFRLIVLFPKQAWFGTVVLNSLEEDERKR